MKSIKEILQQSQIIPSRPQRRNYYAIPDMNADDFRATFENYELAVLSYNTEVKSKNIKIAEYNNDYKKSAITNEHKALQLKFKKQFRHSTISKYNEEAVKWNQIYGFNLIKLKYHTTIKYASQRVFAELVKEQARQLTNRNRSRQKLGMTTRMEKSEPVNLLITRKKIADPLQISKQTVTSHIKRLKQAGIISHYLFRGHDNAFLIRINPKILQISDAFDAFLNRTTQNIENQFFKTNGKQKFDYNVPVIPEHINKNKVNDSEKSESKKEVLNIHRKTDDQNNAKNNQNKSIQQNAPEHNFAAAAGEKYKKISKLLKNNVLHYVLFAKMLFDGIFFNYTPIRNDKLKLEVLYGTLSRAEFREVLISEFIKISAKLWKNWKFGAVYMGEWINLIRLLNSKLFITSNGHLPHKDTMFQMFLDYKWRLRSAINYKTLNPDWVPQRPTEYFNPYLQNTGFARTKKFLKKHKEIIRAQAETDQKQKLNAYRLKRKNTTWKQIEYRITRLEKGKMTPEQFVNWLKYNVSDLTREEVIKLVNNKNASLSQLENILKN